MHLDCRFDVRSGLIKYTVKVLGVVGSDSDVSRTAETTAAAGSAGNGGKK